MIAKALASTKHPLLVAHHSHAAVQSGLHVLQRIDDFSKPVPLEEMYRRIDRLADGNFR